MSQPTVPPAPSTTAQQSGPVPQPSAKYSTGQCGDSAVPLLPSTIAGSSDQYPTCEGLTYSPQIPLPSQFGIPETPQRPLADVRRPFGSPVRPMARLDEEHLHPDLRFRTAGSSSRDPPPSDTVSDEDDMDSLDDENLPRSPSETPFSEPSDVKNKPRKRQRLTLENAEYQRDKRTRDTYYRSTSERLKKNLQILGIYTGCIGILYIHRYQTLKSC